MSTWLIDTALFKTLATPKAKVVQQWCEANNASLYLSAISLTEISAGIGKISANQFHRRNALRSWFDDLTSRFADRIHTVGPEISVRAGAILPRLTSGHPRHLQHDAILVATAQLHGHGLLTRRDGVFGAWMQTPIAIV